MLYVLGCSSVGCMCTYHFLLVNWSLHGYEVVFISLYGCWLTLCFIWCEYSCSCEQASILLSFLHCSKSVFYQHCATVTYFCRYWAMHRPSRHATTESHLQLPIFILNLFVGNGALTQGLLLIRQALYHSNQAPSPFGFTYFSGRASFFCPQPGWTTISYLPASSWDDR